jgi:hypothetical protein
MREALKALQKDLHPFLRSKTLAGSTFALSTKLNRLRIDFIAALGLVFRMMRTRRRSRTAVCSFSYVPSLSSRF